MSGLFSTFNVAKRGINVQQKAIDVTSHNISNANTVGYSRQRARIETTRPFGMPTLNTAAEPGQLGTGAQIAAIERIRDNFLDYQIRTENSTLSKYDARDKFLTEVESIINEPTDTGISSLIGKFFDSWQQLSKQPQGSNARTVVAQQSAALADALNHAANQLNKLQQNSQDLIKNNVTDINSLLNQLDNLNREIIGVRCAGNMPNDLMDRRDLLLDELSSKFNISIDRKSYEGINIKPADDNGMKVPNLISADKNEEVSRFSFVSSVEKDPEDSSGSTYKITYYKLGNMNSESNKQTITVKGMDDITARQLKETRVLWSNTEGVAVRADGSKIEDGSVINFMELKSFVPYSGELKGNMSIHQDINDYKEQLNKLAKAIAFSVNAVHSGLSDASSNTNKDYLPFFVNKGTALYSKNNEMTNLDAVLDAESEITAENISINKEILYDVMKIKTRTHDNEYSYPNQNDKDGETDGARALAIARIRDSLIRIQDFGESIKSRKDLFDVTRGGSSLKNNGMEIESNINGMKIDSFFKDTVDKLGVQAQEAKRIVRNQLDLLDSMVEMKNSISGVSLDEEMADLIQFQHAYQANAKVIATVDELLDVIINGLKR
ncbi:flagellar hook-associated protein 1 FlgK [Clostridium amylolyticum]|uniref:Flagellar hook-associated protein 1 n=1 Tax=Clostridium amylolyticum TaxID=1121298 RepID=A0A1M6CCM5_9CLOT|nr:flagellar hook-associated protein FlgK [Clostridium amylolyticum]SHI58747.1 flagellar hook-associated protein 1 FlgK [Clostridium amylolyticum]